MSAALTPQGATEPGTMVRGYILPGKVHPLLAADKNPGYASLRKSFERVRREIEASDADLLIIYSTKWLSVIGHQIQADPKPKWVHVDYEFHELGEIPYEFEMDAEFSHAYRDAAEKRGLHARTVAYHGFPIDSGTVTALKLLNPNNRIPACVVSCNMYADRAETLVLGKAARDAVRKLGRRAVAISITSLSNRMHTDWVDYADDHIASPKDDEWNRKILEILAEGRLEDVSQLARQFSSQAHGDQKFKAIWWLAALMGQTNDYSGEVIDYQPIFGSGAGVVSLQPVAAGTGDIEFDEDDVEYYHGERSVLAGGDAPSTQAAAKPLPHAPSAVPSADTAAVRTEKAPKPVGAYPHARRVGEFLFLSGIGPRHPETDEIPGGPVRDAEGMPRDYDVAAQTQAVIDNARIILEAAGSSLRDVVDVQVFLIDMDRDFAAFNAVYAEHFASIGPTRTTVEVRALPTPIAVEFKIMARPD